MGAAWRVRMALNYSSNDWMERFKTAAALGLPVMLYAMLEMIAPALVHGLVPPAVANWFQLVLATPVVFWAGAPLLMTMPRAEPVTTSEVVLMLGPHHPWWL